MGERMQYLNSHVLMAATVHRKMMVRPKLMRECDIGLRSPVVEEGVEANLSSCASGLTSLRASGNGHTLPNPIEG